MELDIVAMSYGCAKKVGDRNQEDFEEKVKLCFCEAFIEELKKVSGSDLAPHYLESIYTVEDRRTRVIFEF